MLKKLKEIWSIKTLRSKIIFTLFIVAFIRLGSNIPAPYIRPDAVSQIFNRFGTEMGMINAITWSITTNGIICTWYCSIH